MFKIGNDKHYRMTEESLKFIEMRDKQKYPKESLFVNAAIIFTRMQNMVLQNGQTLLRQQKNSMEKEKNQLLYLVKISR